MPAVPAHHRYPGLKIDPRLPVYDDEGRILRLDPVHAVEAGVFLSATRMNLRRLEHGEVGKSLLETISKRHLGFGTRGQNPICTIYYGQGTLTRDFDADFYERTAIARTSAAFHLSIPFAELDAVTIAANRRPGRIGNRAIVKVGEPASAMVTYNPLVDRSIHTLARLGVETPGFIALAHELIHALHIMSGDRIAHADAARATLIEEARTVGAGKYKFARLSENAIRDEHNLPRRNYFDVANDCDNL